ncbi:MAG: hypothetical protein ACI84E_002391, partial [Planctomycetota bacterium]
ALFANLVVLLIFQLLLPKSPDPNPQLTPKP